MPEQVAELPANSAGRPPGSKYDQYFDGNVWKLTPGDDGPAKIQIFRTSLYTAAKTRGFKLVTRVKDGFLFVQATPRA